MNPFLDQVILVNGLLKVCPSTLKSRSVRSEVLLAMVVCPNLTSSRVVSSWT